MPRSNKLCRKRKFRGNQYKSFSPCVNDADYSESEVPKTEPRPSSSNTDKPTPQSASSRKVDEIDDCIGELEYNNVVISLGILGKALMNATVCKMCKRKGTLSLQEDESSRQGLACKLSVVCSKCDNMYEFCV